jgi:hypothetical protein
VRDDDQRVIDARDDLEFMQRPHLWPLGGVLPVKLAPWVAPATGVVPAELPVSDRAWPTGYLESPGGGIVLPVVELNAGGRVDYGSFEALVCAGWRVD